MTETFILDLTVVIGCAAVLAVAAHFLRQPLIVAYLATGFLIGPHSPWPAARLVQQPDFVRGVGGLGLVLLLFLLGLVLHPERLLRMLRQASLVTLCSATTFFLVGFGLTLAAALIAPEAYDLTWQGMLFVGFATAFSSTLLVVKLLPTRRLHESEVGTVAIGILIVQDLLAIGVLLVMATVSQKDTAAAATVWWRLPAGVAMLVAAFPLERHGLRRLMRQIERYPELIFILSLAWCFVLAEGAHRLGFSREIGAFVAGLALARSPLSLYIWEKVAPLRDFFVVLLFFSLGAMVDIQGVVLPVLLLAALLAMVLALLKPYVFRLILRRVGTDAALSTEVGWRLGQCSEFGLVIDFLAFDQGFIGHQAFEIILVTILLSFLVSTYLVVMKYPSPLGISPGMQQA